MAEADPFDRLAERARTALSLAQETSEKNNQHCIDTEHLLMGIVAEGRTTSSPSMTVMVLDEMGVALLYIQEEIEGMVEDHPASTEVGLTSAVRRAISLSFDGARRLNHHYVGTEHLLWGLREEGEGVAAQALDKLGVTSDRILESIRSVLSQPNPGTMEGVIQRRKVEQEFRGQAKPTLEGWIAFLSNQAVDRAIRAQYIEQLNDLLKEAQEGISDTDQPS